MTLPSLASVVRRKMIWEPKRRLHCVGAHALALVLTLGSGVAAATAGPVDEHLRQQLSRADADTAVAVIVTVRPGAKPGVLARLRRFGVDPSHDFTLVESFAATLPLKVVRALANDPDVLSVSSDTPVVSSMTLDTASLNQVGNDTSPLTSTTLVESAATDSSTASGWEGGSSLSSTETSTSTAKRTVVTSLLRATLGLSADQVAGSSITVAVIDSGIAPVADLKTRIVASYDFTAGGKLVKPADAYGHGTHVAGLIGGNGSASNGLYPGAAPAVKFVSLKVLDAAGAGSTANVIKAMQFAVAQKAKLNIKIINLSLGHPIFEPAASDPLVQAVEAAVRAGIVVVVASGNYGINPSTGLAGYAGVTSPGNAPSAVTVGSQQLNGTAKIADDVVPIYSSRGPTWYDGFVKPEVVAPGHRQVASAAPNSTLHNLFATSYPQFLLNNGQYMTLSGTSMATGVASGVAAQVLYARPGLTPAAVKAVMQYTASSLQAPTGGAYDTLTQGTGAINGAGAIALATAIDPSIPVGSYWLTHGLTPFTEIAGEVRAWSENIVWGTSTLSGDTVDANRLAWADNVVWGSNVVWGDNVVWGTNVVWGDNVVWGSNVVWGTGLVGSQSGDNVVWGTTTGADNVVWGTLSSVVGLSGDNVVWGTSNVLRR